MLLLDLPTLLAITVLMTGFLGGLLIWLWWRDRGQLALAFWGTSRLLAAVALPLLLARGSIPNWASIGLGNAIVCLSYGLTWSGARRFEDRPQIPLLLAAGPLLWLFACLFPAFYSVTQVRVTLLGTIVAAYSAGAAMEFRRGQTLEPLPSRPLLVAMLATVALLYGLSGPMTLVLPFRNSGAGLPASWWYALIISLNVNLTAGTSILLVGLLKEMAELRAVTALASARDAAAEASEQKSRFLARMSHELRTPLNGVLGLAQVLANDPEQGQRQRRRAATLEQAGQHLLAILNEVLDLSRIEAGRLELLTRPVMLADFLEETLALVRDASVAKAIQLRLDAAPELPKAVVADPMRVRQILLNLLSNALKFTPPGGSVSLAVARGHGDTVTFAVSDTGSGVPAELRPRLFQDYAQAQGDASSGGSGLGLAISALLAQAMGGSVVHTDRPDGEGSCFTLELPLPATTPDQIQTNDQSTLPAPGLRILVVDDVRVNRTLMAALLMQAGHLVETVADGASALEAIRHGPLPDIVLLDQSMPGMDGPAVVRHIRGMPGPAGRLPILAVTASALPDEIEASLAGGMDGHVAKPVERATLLAAIADVLDRASVAS